MEQAIVPAVTHDVSEAKVTVVRPTGSASRPGCSASWPTWT